MQKITPCLFFDRQAEEAAEFYVSIFKNSKIGKKTYYGQNMHMPKGTLLTVTFELEGQEFLGLNGGTAFPFTEAVSLIVDCKDQKELDTLWEKLSAGGSKGQCSWLKDKFGLSWQICSRKILDQIAGDPVKTQNVMNELMKMTKLDLAVLERALKEK